MAVIDNHLLVVEAENAGKHAARAAAAAEQDAQVLALFDKKLASLAAAPASAVPAAAPAPPAPAPAPPAPAPAVGPAVGSGTVAAIANTTLALTAQLPNDATKDMQIAALSAALKKFEDAAKPLAEFDRRVTIDPATLPKAKVPNQEVGRAYFAIHKVLELWISAGADDAFTRAQLAQFAVNDDGPVPVAKDILGAASWGSWYPHGDPLAASIVPQQLALQVHCCLNGIRSLGDQEAEDKAGILALEGYKEIATTAKRRRQE